MSFGGIVCFPVRSVPKLSDKLPKKCDPIGSIHPIFVGSVFEAIVVRAVLFFSLCINEVGTLAL